MMIKNTVIGIVCLIAQARYQFLYLKLFIKTHKITKEQKALKTVLSVQPDGIAMIVNH